MFLNSKILQAFVCFSSFLLCLVTEMTLNFSFIFYRKLEDGGKGSSGMYHTVLHTKRLLLLS